MATFDQLPADQRAIIELVLKRGRSYSQLSDLLGMPETRVRELAREALVVLAPVTADRVDPEWRNQVADYALGQQAGAEATATQGHLRRSEPARAWLGSLLDSLEQLYDKDSLPDLPEADGERPRGRERRPREERSRTGERSARGAKAAAATADVADTDDDETEPAKAKKPVDARTRRQERRLIFGGVVLVVLLVVLVLILTDAFGGGDDNGGESTNASTGTTAAQNGNGQNGNTQIVGELALKPTDADAAKDTVGIAQIATDGKKSQLGVRAKLPALKSNHAYEVWLYNKKDDAVSLGAARTDAQGNFEGAAELPAGYEKYKFIDISDEPVNKDAQHSGNSVLRGALADLVTPEQQQQSQQGQGTQTTP